MGRARCADGSDVRERDDDDVDAELLAARARLVGLYEANVDDLYRFCLARTGSADLAQEACADTFLAAARTAAARPEEAMDRAWLFVVARRRIVDRWRSEERHRRRSERLGFLAPREIDDPGAFDSSPVLRALESLPARQRAALTMRYLDEMSVSEVAEAMDVSYRTAESLLARGRRGFTAAWRAEQGGPDIDASGGLT